MRSTELLRSATRRPSVAPSRTARNQTVGRQPPPGTFNLAYVQKIQKAGGFRQYEALCKKSLIALLEPKFPQIPAEVIPTIVEFWAHPGDYCMTFGPATLVRRGLEQIAARVATMNIS